MKLNFLIFDLDGVITSEEGYWEGDRLSLWELMTSDQFLGIRHFFDPRVALPVGEDPDKFRILSSTSIMRFKNRAINSNLDITFLAFTICVTHVLQWLLVADEDAAQRLKKEKMDGKFISTLSGELQGRGPSIRSTQPLMDEFFLFAGDVTGPQLLAQAGKFIEEKTFMGMQDFHHGALLWETCRDVFQGWVTGAAFSSQSSIATRIPLIRKALIRSGIINAHGDDHFKMEKSIIPVEKIHRLLNTLRSAGFSFGVATSRSLVEALNAINKIGIMEYFDRSRIITQLEVIEAEKIVNKTGGRTKLSKPHHYPVLKAIYPEKSVQELLNLNVFDHEHSSYAMVGDAISDILSAKNAGCEAIAVLSGAGKDSDLENEQRVTFKKMGADRVIATIEELPQLLNID